MVTGSPGVGKSIFVKTLLEKSHDFYTLEDPHTLSRVRKDPKLFLTSLTSSSVIADVQKALSLLSSLKNSKAQNKNPGSLILTSAIDIWALPHFSDSLAGRLRTYILWPFSQGEIEGRKEDFISFVFNDRSFPLYKSTLSLEGYIERMIRGGYPEVFNSSDFHERNTWFASYLRTLIEKEIRNLFPYAGSINLPLLIQACATQCGRLLSFTDLSLATGLHRTTLKRYFALLHHMSLIMTLPAWTKNLKRHVFKTPKLYLNDTGLMIHLLKSDPTHLFKDKALLGCVLETFVVMELKKQLGWSQQRCHLYHYRARPHQKIDFILEAADSRIVALDIKLSSSLSSEDFEAMDLLQKDSGGRFHRGIIFYMGDSIRSFGSDQYAVPLSFLWEHP